MRIAFYTAPLQADKATWQEEDWFAFEVVTHFTKEYTGHEFLWITPHFLTGTAFQFDAIPHFPLSEKAPSAFSFSQSYDRKLFSLLKDQKADAVLSLNAALPARFPCPSCVVVHHIFSASAPGRKIRRFAQQLERAKFIAAISGVEKEKLSSQYGISPEKITVVHRGIHKDFRPLDWEERERVKSDYTDGREYFIYTGEINSQQNIISLLKAFSILKKRLRSNMALVLAGALNKKFKDFPGLLATYHFRGDVKWIKTITLEERTRLIGGAYALICPAAREEFMPEIPEAFASRVPVLAADAAITRETGEEAGLYFDPANVEGMGDALCEIYKDENLRARLIAVGEIQVKKYSWDRTAGLLWSIIGEAALQQK